MKAHKPDFDSRRAGKLVWALAVTLLITAGLVRRLPATSANPIPEPASPARPVSLAASAGPEEDLLNVLLIGHDHREGTAGSRSDTMILCSFHRETKTITMTSFLRDLYVPIPGHGSNRINAAYAFGGADLLEQTLEHNFDLHIAGHVEVDFSQFSGIIDLLGGVELELRSDEAKRINAVTGSSLTEGTHRLSGAQALCYARIRDLDPDGDASRTRRQRKVLSALVDAYKGLGLRELISLVTEILPLIQTDLNSGQLLRCALDVAPHLSQAAFVSQHIPAPGTYWNETIQGMMVLRTDMDKTRDSLKKSLSGK